MCEKEVKSTEEAIEKKAVDNESAATEEAVIEEGQSITDDVADLIQIADDEDATPLEKLDLEQSVSVKDVKSFSQREKVHCTYCVVCTPLSGVPFLCLWD